MSKLVAEIKPAGEGTFRDTVRVTDHLRKAGYHTRKKPLSNTTEIYERR